MFNDLKNKVCIITGGAGLIGAAFSRSCAEYGAKVVIVDMEEGNSKSLALRLIDETKNKNIFFQKCDITSEKSVVHSVKAIIKKLGRIDALVNNAYPRNKNYGRRFEDVSYDDFCDNVNTHAGGYFLMTKEVAKIMMEAKKGNIIFMGSIYGFRAPRFEIYEGTEMTMPVEYSMIKGGIINMAKYLASYLGPYKIRVNCISPGGVFNGQDDGFVKKYSRKICLGGKKMLNPDDIAGILPFLLSDASSHITGQNIVVDDGWTL